MSLAKRFAFGLAWNFIGKIIVGLCGAAMSVLIARNLGKTELGIYASIITIPATLRLFTSFGFETILNVKLPVLVASENSREKIRFLVRKFFFYRLWIILATVFIFYLLRGEIHRIYKKIDIDEYFIVTFLYLTALMFFSYFTMIFRALMRIKFISLIEGFNQFFNLLLLIIFFGLGYGIYAVLHSFIISTIIVTIILFYFARDFIFGKCQKIAVTEFYDIGMASALGGLLSFGLGAQADIVIMNYFNVPSEEIGFYFLCFSLVSMMGLHLEGIGALSQSAFSESFAKDGKYGLALSWNMVTKVVVLLSMPIFVFAVFQADIIIQLLYGKQYLEAVIYFQTFALLACVSILSGSSFCMPVFYLINKKTLGLIIQIAGGLLNIVLDIALISKFGVLGIVIATSFSHALIGVVQMFFVLHYTKAPFPFLFEAKILLICIIALFPVYFLEGDGIFAIISKMILYGIGFTLAAFLLKPLDQKNREMILHVDKRLFALVKYF